jgi:hypothetical protein
MRDGRTIAYATQQGTSETQLYLRDLNAFEARPVMNRACSPGPPATRAICKIE